jgi:hypothetical protein
LERGKEEHDILFERTRDVAKKEDIKGMATWKEIIMALTGMSLFLGIIGTILMYTGVI